MVKIKSTLAIIVAFTPFLRAVSTKYSLPLPTGNHEVGTVQFQLVDKSRNDPFAPTITPREIMVSVFYPSSNAADYPPALYIPQRVAAIDEVTYQLPNGTMNTFQPNARQGAPLKVQKEWEVVLFSPGFGASRCYYTTFAEELASYGYVVVTIDHPYDTSAVEFPDGRLVISNITAANLTTELANRLVDTRARDVSFVINALKSRSIVRENLPGVRKSGFDFKKVGIFGHSLGGATSAAAMLNDTRILGGLDMDGTFFGPVIEAGLDRPFMIMSAGNHSRATDPSWESTWGNLRGWRLDVNLDRSRHLIYMDFPQMVDIAHLTDVIPPEFFEQYFGTINYTRASEIQRVYIRAFFDFVIRGKEQRVLEGPDPRYPEILFQY